MQGCSYCAEIVTTLTLNNQLNLTLIPIDRLLTEKQK